MANKKAEQRKKRMKRQLIKRGKQVVKEVSNSVIPEYQIKTEQY
ncbi:hypothetical protein [Bacillus cereus]|nr:hypothetical protein [Bacillus cereus]MDA2548333.1 hypothetical protein [Bacillus cereus]MDA2553615.1 hypothetical protein [Bacillus cereus]MDZ4540850.1 hypothetical protein [Bacillus cereus]WBV49248.1 hypothetical protein PFY08_06395 [Bacillus cereus]